MENIQHYILELTRKYPAIISVWLFGSRANNSFNDNSDWDLIAFGDKDTLKALRSDATFFRDQIDLFIIYNGNDAENPYSDKNLSLTLLQWKPIDTATAK